MKKLLVCAALTLSLAAASVQAQEPDMLFAGKTGVGVNGFSGSPNWLVKYFLSDRFAAELQLGYSSVMPGADAPTGTHKVNGSDVRVGVAGMYYFLVDRVAPYVGAHVLYGMHKDAGFVVDEPDSKNTMVFGALLGAEFFVHNRFSLGLQTNLDLTSSLKRDKPKEATDSRIDTSAEMIARFYFH
jgi:opacity protein-like surface antigen